MLLSLKKIKVQRKKKTLRISFWHLLMNLKNKKLFKKLLKWANKRQNNFNIYNVVFKKKKKKKNEERHL